MNLRPSLIVRIIAFMFAACVMPSLEALFAFSLGVLSAMVDYEVYIVRRDVHDKVTRG